jgi:hypothetical protein
MKIISNEKQRGMTPDSDLSRPWSPQLFEEITDLLAEALVQDFQEHRRATVKSPQGTNHKFLLTERENQNK